MNNNMGLIRFMHSVILEMAMLKSHSYNFGGNSFHAGEYWEWQTSTYESKAG